MKRVVKAVEVEGDGLESLLDQYVQVWCLNYIYAGRLVGVNQHDIVLSEAVVVYETGGLRDKAFQNAQPTSGSELFVRTSAIESYCVAPQLEDK